MKTYAPVTEAVLEDLKTIVGAEYVLTEPEKLEQYQTDEETDPRKFHLPEAVVLPTRRRSRLLSSWPIHMMCRSLSAAAAPVWLAALFLYAAVLSF